MRWRRTIVVMRTSARLSCLAVWALVLWTRPASHTPPKHNTRGKSLEIPPSLFFFRSVQTPKNIGNPTLVAKQRPRKPYEKPPESHLLSASAGFEPGRGGAGIFRVPWADGADPLVSNGAAPPETLPARVFGFRGFGWCRAAGWKSRVEGLRVQGFRVRGLKGRRVEGFEG